MNASPSRSPLRGQQQQQQQEYHPVMVDDLNVTNNNNNTSNTLFVGNLPFSIEEKDLYELFGRFGRIKNVKVHVDRSTGKSLGFAFVDFEGRQDAENVLAKFNNYEWNERRLRLDWKKNDRENFSHIFHSREHFEDRGKRIMKNSIVEKKRYTPYEKREDIKRRYSKRNAKDSNHSALEKIKYLYNQKRIDEALQEYFKNPNAFAASFLITRENNMNLALNIYNATKNNSTIDLQVIITFMKALERRNEHPLINYLWNDVMSIIQKMDTREISKINVITWSTLINGLCKKKRINNALKLLDIMHQNNMKFDNPIYSSFLTKCNSKEWLEFGKRIHYYLLQNNGLNIILRNCLINMYGKCGSLEEAIKVFNNIELSERTIFTWAAMISAYGEHGKGKEALELVEEMKERGIELNEKIITCVLRAFCDVGSVENAAEILFSMETRFGVKPDGFHCTCVLNACGDYGLVELGKKIHRHLAEHNYRDSNIWKGNLIEMYAKCNYIEESIAVFNSLKEEEKDINIWTSIISAYSVSRGSEKEALNMFTKMQQVGIKPDNRTISFVLQACCAAGMIESAAGIFFSMERNFGIKPDGYHYNCMLTACADNGLISLGKRIHNHLIEYNYPQNTILKNNLINMYGKCGCLKQAYDIFHSMKFSERDIITWTVMISVCGENKRGEEALKLFAQMQEHGITPTEQTLSCVLNSCCKSGFIDVAVEILFSMESKFGFKPIGYHYSRLLSVCADNGLLSLGKTIHKHLLDNNVPQNINLKNNLMNMYAKCGCFEDALEIFNHIEEAERDIFTWTAIISAYGQHGKGKESLEMFERMQKAGIKPDEATIICILNACSHSGLVQEALQYFHNLEYRFGMKPNLMHCNCIVDVLGRAGKLQDAEDFISNYMRKEHIQPNFVTWMTLLSACRSYMDVNRAEKVAQIILEIAPNDASVYVLLSNIYAQSGNLDKAEELRQLMDKKGMKKLPGLSTVEVNGKVYNFVSDDSLHPNINEIHQELQLLTEEMIKAGYNPDTSWVTRDVENEEKKELICRHSEKLAMVWAMMNTPYGATVRLTKNLRICGDCHNATKIISKIRNREIIVRDASRYHHFKNGKCSCGDYW